MSSEIRHKITYSIFKLPASFYEIVFFIIPATILVVVSFWRVSNYEIVREFTVENYIYVFTSKIFWVLLFRSIVNGLLIAFIVTFISYIFCYSLNFKVKKGKDTLFFIILITMFVSYLVRAYGWRTILGEKGLINYILMSLKIINEPLTILLFSRFAVVVTFIQMLIPLSSLVLYSAIRNIDYRLIEAAKDLGCNSISAFYRVTLPLSFTGIRTSILFAFIISSSDFITPLIVGGKSGVMIGNFIVAQYYKMLNWPGGSAMVITVVTILVIVYCLVVYILSKIIIKDPKRYLPQVEEE